MKTRIFKSLLALMLTFVALPMMAQDYMNIFFKNGDHRKFYLKNVVQITTSKYDAEGIRHSDYQFQHIKTESNQYVYDLADIDNISFTKLDEELVKQNFATATTAVLPVLYDCETIEDAEKNLNMIKNSECIEDAWSDGHELHVKMTDGIKISYHFRHDEENYEEKAAKSMEKIKAILPIEKISMKPSDRKLKVVIANQQFSDESKSRQRMNKLFDQLVSEFISCDIDAEHLPNPTVEFFYSDIYVYDLVLFPTHGSYNKENKTHSFATGEYIGEYIKKEWDEKSKEEKQIFINQWWDKIEEICKRYDTTKEDGYIYLSSNDEIRNNKKAIVFHAGLVESFFLDIVPPEKRFSNPNSIFFTGACHSMDGNDLESSHSLAKVFTERGLGTFWGYSGGNYRGPEAGYKLFSSMLYGKSLSKAYRDLDEKFRVETDNPDVAVLTRYTNQVNQVEKSPFLLPVYTDFSTHEKVMEDFKKNSSVKVQGTMTSLNPEGIDAGFFYGTDKNNLSINKDSESALNLGKGNIVFSAQLEKLEPGKTYYYCAYTYDGLYYNYGDTCSFTIDKVQDLSIAITGNIDLEVGASANVRIMSGSGDYTLSSDKPNVAKPSLVGEFITVEALSAGKATITVTDNITKQTASFTVTVTDPAPTDIPAEAIDLGLPSGTLWASYNVGATKPEEYGSYFAWGETQEKKSYYFTNYSLCDGTVSSCHNIGDDISGTVYDVAHVRWGSEWCMPSKDDFYELTRQCEHKETTVNGVKGYQFTGPNGKSIFLPYAGYFWNTENSKAGTNGSYWSSTLTTSVNHSQEMSFSKGEVLWDCYINRFAGLSVRPVKKGNSTTPDLSLESTSPVNLKVRQNHSVKIISGSGDYTVKSSNVAVATATISDWSSMETSEQGKCVSLKATGVGESTITVTDTKSGQKVSFLVAVTQNVDLLKLSTYSLNLQVGETGNVVITSCSGEQYLVATSDASVATVSVDKSTNTIKVRAVGAGTCDVTVNDSGTGETATVAVTVTNGSDMSPGEAIDLGLPSGTLWASCNVGATKPEEYGLYFAWGELEARNNFEWDTYQYYNSNEGWVHIGEDIGGTNYDAARNLWGDEWRIPSSTQFRELIDNCIIKETKINGVYGRMFTGKNGNSIFMPAGGSIVDNNNAYEGYSGYYMSSTLSSSYKGMQQILFFKQRGELIIVDNGRANGHSVRPVRR